MPTVRVLRIECVRSSLLNLFHCKIRDRGKPGVPSLIFCDYNNLTILLAALLEWRVLQNENKFEGK
jgi:hypothetical protein